MHTRKKARNEKLICQYPPDKGFTRARPYDIEVGWSHRKGTDRHSILIVKNGILVNAAVGGFKDSTRRCSGIDDIGIARFADYRTYAVPFLSDIAVRKLF